MKHRFLRVILALALIAALSAGMCPAVLAADSGMTTVSVSFKYGQTEARNMLKLINSFRTSNPWYWNSSNTAKVTVKNLKPLKYDYALEAAAMQRAAEIALYYSHTRPTGESCFTVYPSNYAMGENIAWGHNTFVTAQSMFTAFREDNEKYAKQGHRRAMISDEFNAVGIAHVDFNGAHYWVQIFAYLPSPTTKATKVVNGSKTMKVTLDNSLLTNVTASLSAKSVSVDVGASASLPKVTAKFTVKGGGYRNATLSSTVTPSWRSSNSAIAAVSGNTVTGKSAGKTNLTAKVGGKSLSVPVTVSTAFVPSLTAKANGSSGVQLSWTTSGKYSYYSVYELLNGKKTFIKTIAGSSATLSNVTAGSHTYYIRPKTAKDSSAKYGSFSNGATVTVSKSSSGESAPVLTAKLTAADKVQLSWTVTKKYAYYSVYEIINGKYSFIKSVTSTSASLTGVKAGSHTYAVRPKSSKGSDAKYGPYSNAETVTVGSGGSSSSGEGALTLKATQPAAGKVQLSWTQSKKYGYYSVYEIVDGKKVLLTTVAGATTVTLKDVTQGDHEYVIRPKSSKGSGAQYGQYSNTVLVSLEDWKLNAPTLTASSPSGGQVKLQWTVKGSAAEYHSIYEVVGGKLKYIKVVKSMSATLVNVSSGKHTYVVYPCSSNKSDRTYGKGSNQVTVTVNK